MGIDRKEFNHFIIAKHRILEEVSRFVDGIVSRVIRLGQRREQKSMRSIGKMKCPVYSV